jgi:hypothetical protein
MQSEQFKEMIMNISYTVIEIRLLKVAGIYKE